MSYGLTTGGQVDLPFDHHDIRVYIDNLFVEGWLHPIKHAQAASLSKAWVSFGVKTNPAEDRQRCMTRPIESLQTSIPVEDAKHTAWFQFACCWAELKVLINEQSDNRAGDLDQQFRHLQSIVDTNLTGF